MVFSLYVLGCIVGKGKFIKPDGGFYTIDDLNIGESLFVNGKEFKIINCDSFTRTFLTEMGYRVPSPQPNVFDPVTKDRKEANKMLSYRKPFPRDFKIASFLKNHPRRLRFYGTYGNNRNLFEDERECTLYYDLANGTIKLVEERSINKWIEGRFDTRVLLRPTLVPKRRHLTDSEAWRIVGRLEGGQTQAETEATGVAQSVISRIWNRFLETGSAGRRPGQGRRRATTPNEDRYLTLTARRHQNISSNK
ncbi:EF-hand domain-containing family member C2 [Nephila pilipes]|uniref:EF-hand domain-containing family member C2 n=1 Tax=Nephila pilipes TaxID=299642 RepID=A0A8X6QTQ5_NEPPI|nr:EF-hand domain-containing family member C2 [Nephila pilipes]